MMQMIQTRLDALPRKAPLASASTILSFGWMEDMSARRMLDRLEAQGLTREEDRPGLEDVARQFSVRLSEHVLGVADEPGIARQYVPDLKELHFAPEELDDPIADAAHSPVPGIVHRYPDRVLLTPTKACAVYCRFCFRREQVGANGAGLTTDQLDAACAYIAAHSEIWEVVITGGDPLSMSNRRIVDLMQRLSAIPHLGVIRFHTRLPVVEPDKVDAAMLAALDTDKALFIAVHANQAEEFTAEAEAACRRLVKAGIPLISQSVLLAGVNDSAEALERLMRAFVRNRIKPYYLHHLDLARGTGHFRVTLAKGRDLVAGLRGRVSGLCQPSYMLDIPGGHGKVPLGADHVTDLGDGRYTIRDPWGKLHAYDDPAAREGE